MTDVEIIRSKRKSMEIQICPDGHLRVRAPYFTTDTEICDFLREKSNWISKHRAIVKERRRREQETDWHRLSAQEIKELADEAIRILPQKVQRFAEKIGVDYGRITIRNQKTRWGSCSGKGNLNFNCLLMLTPDDVQDYVVIHELCHLKQMNHSSKFWAEVEHMMPDYKQKRKWLKENGEEIMRRVVR